MEQGAAQQPYLLHLLADLGDPRLCELLPASQQHPHHPQQQLQQLALLRVDHLGAVYGRPEDLAAAAEGSLGRTEQHTPVPPPQLLPQPSLSGRAALPAAAQPAAHGLTHFAPVWLRGTHWQLTTAEVSALVPRGPDQHVLAELEDLFLSAGATGRGSFIEDWIHHHLELDGACPGGAMVAPAGWLESALLVARHPQPRHILPALLKYHVSCSTMCMQWSAAVWQTRARGTPPWPSSPVPHRSWRHVPCSSFKAFRRVLFIAMCVSPCTCLQLPGHRPLSCNPATWLARCALQCRAFDRPWQHTSAPSFLRAFQQNVTSSTSVQLRGSALKIRPSEKNLEAMRLRHPAEAAAADRLMGRLVKQGAPVPAQEGPSQQQPAVAARPSLLAPAATPLPGGGNTYTLTCADVMIQCAQNAQ